MKPSLVRGFSTHVATATLGLFFAATAVANTVSYTGTSVVFEGSTTGTSGLLATRATFTTGSAGVLKLRLENISPAASGARADLLTSFYFNVLSGTTTGTSAPLSYQNAVGQVYYTVGGFVPDFPVKYTPPPPPGGTVTDPAPPELSNLQAFNAGDHTWQFRSGLALANTTPPLAFGVGTVGNDDFDPDSFNGNIVGNDDFGVFVGEVTANSLDGFLLVKDAIHFEFAGFGAFDLTQISPYGVFGFGSDPEFIITVPEPTGIVIAALGIAACGAYQQRRRRLAALAGAKAGG